MKWDIGTETQASISEYFLEGIKSTEADGRTARTMVPRPRGREGPSLFNRHKVSVLQGNQLLESSDTPLGLELTALWCTLQEWFILSRAWCAQKTETGESQV